jgi:hypothetical protein
MRETQLSARQIGMVLLIVVMFMGGMMGYVEAALPSTSDPVGSKRTAIVCVVIAVLAAVWFGKLVRNAIRDKRRGVERGPAKVSGRFNVWFGAAVAAGGIACSALTYWSAAGAGGGIWTLYYGMILWGVIQMLIGWKRIGDATADDSKLVSGDASSGESIR